MNLTAEHKMAKWARTPTHKTEEYIEIAAKMYTSGHPVTDIIQSTGKCRTIVIKWLKKSGVYKNHYHSEETKQEVIRLYTIERIGIPSIGKKMGLNNATVRGILVRSNIPRRQGSEAHAITTNKRHYPVGRGGYWQSCKTGKWQSADSLYELARMQQLDDDPEVVYWDRESVPLISYGHSKIYVPDFYVKYYDGHVEIEEIKAKAHLELPTNKHKFAAAEQYCSAHGIRYKIMTETELGKTYIKNFQRIGLLKDEEKEAAKRAFERQRYEATKEERSRKQKEQYIKNKDKKLKKQKEYRAANKDKIREMSKSWQCTQSEHRREKYLKNAEEIKRKTREYWAQNAEMLNKRRNERRAEKRELLCDSKQVTI